MLSRLARVGLGVLIALVVAGLPVGSASAGNWSPAGAEASIDSTNITIVIGAKTITCGAFVGGGTLSSPASATWNFAPKFSKCTNAVSVEGSWTAKDENSSEAIFEIPKKAKALTIEISESCKVVVENGGAIGAKEDYENGTNGIEEPSLMSLVGQTVTVKDSPSKCVAPCNTETTTAEVSGDFVLYNFTSTTEAIKVS